MKLQESVTQKRRESNGNLRKFLCLVFVGIFLLVAFLGIIISASFRNKKYKFADGATFYVYYTETETTLARAKTLASTQQSSGGAGFIYDDKKFYICAFLYEDQIKANEVVQKNKVSYENGGIITKSTVKLSNRAKKVIKNEERLISSVHLLEDAFNAFYDLAIECDTKNLGEVEVFNKFFVYYEKFMKLSAMFEDANTAIALNVDAVIISIKDYLSSSKTAIERSSGLKYLCFEILGYYNNVAGWLNTQ